MQKALLFFLFLNMLTGFSQTPGKVILWEEERKLTWSDFQAEPDTTSPFHASTNSGISFSWALQSSEDKSDFDYEIKTTFQPGLSWVKEKEKSRILLAHEQLHFDITELHARKLRKLLENYKVTKNIKKELNDIYKKIQTERKQMQREYDRETNHSQHKEAEEKWRRSVNFELKKLREFSS